MKSLRALRLVLTWALLTVGVAAADKTPRKSTADYYKAFYNDYDGKLVTLEVACLRTLDFRDAEMEGYTIFYAETYSRGYGRSGSWSRRRTPNAATRPGARAPRRRSPARPRPWRWTGARAWARSWRPMVWT